MAFMEGLPSPEDENQGGEAAPRPTLVPDSSQTHAEVLAPRAEAVVQDRRLRLGVRARVSWWPS